MKLLVRTGEISFKRLQELGSGGSGLKHVDILSQRRCSLARVALDVQSSTELNDYFAELCCDSACKQPTPVQVESGVQVPEISERQVWYCLRHLRKTATGPDLIPFLVARKYLHL